MTFCEFEEESLKVWSFVSLGPELNEKIEFRKMTKRKK
jgi:hypothetical protein